ncbi:MAG: PAS domain S-box protein [Deltaproteobacteria bacterium]|nr:PAS domain S-box protein [Deltaproteobacteria bacterium]
MPNGIKQKIEELEEKHRVIADNLIDAIWVIDAETLKFEHITPSIEKISGYTVDDHISLTLEDRLPPGSFQKVIKSFAEERKKFEQGIKGYRTLELEEIHKDGSSYWVEIRVRFMKEPGKSLKIVGVTREITGRKKVEQQQNESIKQLEEALADKERLLKEVKVLKGLLPICSGCKRICDEHGKWWPLDAYVRDRTEAELANTICPDCEEVPLR